MIDIATWHVLLCEPRAEFKAQKRLQDLGYEAYVPALYGLRQIKVHTMFGVQRRSLKTHKAMLPGYLFCGLTYNTSRGPLYTVNGLRAAPFLRFHGGAAAVVSEEGMNVIRDEEGRQASAKVPGLGYRLGDRVRIVSGPMTDKVGTISALEDAERIEVLMDILGRQTPCRWLSAKQIASVGSGT